MAVEIANTLINAIRLVWEVHERETLTGEEAAGCVYKRREELSVMNR